MIPKGRAVADLRWFYVEAEGDLGLHAQSYEPSDGSAREGYEVARERDRECARWSEVARRLRAMPPGHERVLRLAYTEHRWIQLERWYELAGVAALLVSRVRGISVEAAGRAVVGLAGAEATDMRSEARRALDAALGHYCEDVER